MKIYGNIKLEVNIDETQQYEITEKFIRSVLKYPVNCYIDNKKNLVETWEDNSCRHTRTEKKVLRKATNQDKLYIEFRNMLHKAYLEKANKK